VLLSCSLAQQHQSNPDHLIYAGLYIHNVDTDWFLGDLLTEQHQYIPHHLILYTLRSKYAPVAEAELA
jgi:hypothetical protein